MAAIDDRIAALEEHIVDEPMPVEEMLDRAESSPHLASFWLHLAKLHLALDRSSDEDEAAEGDGRDA